jgi:phosphoribosylaminoimidazole-succinocarboxamide synthase
MHMVETKLTGRESGRLARSRHEMNCSDVSVTAFPGHVIAAQVAEMAIRVYSAARDYAATRGIIIADTKFEFGLDGSGNLGMAMFPAIVWVMWGSPPCEYGSSFQLR